MAEPVIGPAPPPVETAPEPPPRARLSLDRHVRLAQRLHPERAVLVCDLKALQPEPGLTWLVQAAVPLVAYVVEGQLVAAIPAEAGEARLELPLRDLRITWPAAEAGARAACAAPEVLAERVRVEGEVRGEPVPGAEVRGCGATGVIEGPRFSIAVPQGPCALAVVAVHEGRIARGPEVQLPADSVPLAFPAKDAFRPYTDEEVAELRHELEQMDTFCTDLGRFGLGPNEWRQVEQEDCHAQFAAPLRTELEQAEAVRATPAAQEEADEVQEPG